MNGILNIHTHHPAPVPDAVVSTGPYGFAPVENQLYSVGIHPWNIKGSVSPEELQLLAEVCRKPEVAAVGECGIDLLKKETPLYLQIQIFTRQIELSEELEKPMVIHDVRAHDVITGLKRELNPRQPWVVHGFRGKPSAAKMLLDSGIWISLGARFNDETAAYVPEDRLLAETDESELPIERVISLISNAKKRNVRDIISDNSRRFLQKAQNNQISSDQC